MQQAPFSEGNSIPVIDGTRLVLGKITSRVIKTASSVAAGARSPPAA
jgi:hypothetical protein